jgi:hypothetical protein
LAHQTVLRIARQPRTLALASRGMPPSPAGGQSFSRPRSVPGPPQVLAISVGPHTGLVETDMPGQPRIGGLRVPPGPWADFEGARKTGAEC